MSRGLRNMVVIITGASAGIGKALAEQLSAHGAKLVLSARRQDRLEELNRTLGGNHLVVVADVSRPEDCQRLVSAAVTHFGRIDTLVCNAGIGIARSVADTTHDELVNMFAVNLFGTVDCINAAVPIMSRQEKRDGWRGHIVIVTSAAARRGLSFLGVYSATKSAQLGIAEALRVELRPIRIAVTTVHPVGTATEFMKIAENLGNMKIHSRGRHEFQQSAATVARKMIAAIRRPRPEVWPLRIARYGLSFSTLFPGLTDRAMAYHRSNSSPSPLASPERSRRVGEGRGEG